MVSSGRLKRQAFRQRPNGEKEQPRRRLAPPRAWTTGRSRRERWYAEEEMPGLSGGEASRRVLPAGRMQDGCSAGVQDVHGGREAARRHGAICEIRWASADGPRVHHVRADEAAHGGGLVSPHWGRIPARGEGAARSGGGDGP